MKISSQQQKNKWHYENFHQVDVNDQKFIRYHRNVTNFFQADTLYQTKSMRFKKVSNQYTTYQKYFHFEKNNNAVHLGGFCQIFCVRQILQRKSVTAYKFCILLGRLPIKQILIDFTVSNTIHYKACKYLGRLSANTNQFMCFIDG